MLVRKITTDLHGDVALALCTVVRCPCNPTAGWAENFDNEWDMLTNCMSMAVEEERMLKVKAGKLEEELQTLKLEVTNTYKIHMPRDIEKR